MVTFYLFFVNMPGCEIIDTGALFWSYCTTMDHDTFLTIYVAPAFTTKHIGITVDDKETLELSVHKGYDTWQKVQFNAPEATITVRDLLTGERQVHNSTALATTPDAPHGEHTLKMDNVRRVSLCGG